MAGVHDAHVEAGADGVIKKRRVHRLPDGAISPERERDVAHPAADPRQREIFLNPLHRPEERDGVAVVLLDAGRHGQNVRIENNVSGREADLLGEDPVGAGAYLRFPLERVRLPFFVESHDDNRRAVAENLPRMLPENVLSFLEADGVDDPLSLQALQPGLDHRPFR